MSLELEEKPKKEVPDYVPFGADQNPPPYVVDREEARRTRLLNNALREARDWPVDRILDHMFLRIDEFVGEAPQFDDITMMVVRRC